MISDNRDTRGNTVRKRTRSIVGGGVLVAGIMTTSMIAAGALAGDGTNEAPPKVAFVADGRNPADALAAGPIVAQVGGVLCTTSPLELSEGAGACLTDFGPEMVIIVGGPGALPATFEDDIAAITGLDAAAISRAAGDDRYKTAQALGTLLSDLGLNVAFLPVDGKAASATDADHAVTADSASAADDADTLDGLDSTEFHRGPIRVAHSPLNTVVLGGPLGDLTYNLGRAIWEPSGLVAYLGMPLDRPVDIGPVDADDVFSQLIGLEICFSTESLDDEIINISLHEQASDDIDDQDTILSEEVTWSSTIGTCQVVDVSSGVTSSRPLSLAILYSADAPGAAHALNITGVMTTWGPPAP